MVALDEDDLLKPKPDASGNSGRKNAALYRDAATPASVAAARQSAANFQEGRQALGREEKLRAEGQPVRGREWWLSPESRSADHTAAATDKSKVPAEVMGGWQLPGCPLYWGVSEAASQSVELCLTGCNCARNI